MPLSTEAIEKLRAIYYAEYGREITSEEAQEMGQRLIELVRLLLRPLPAATHGANDEPPL